MIIILPQSILYFLYLNQMKMSSRKDHTNKVNGKVSKWSFIKVPVIFLFIFYQECEYDSLTVHSKMGEDIYKKHGIFCGSRMPPMVTSEKNAMRIEFTSDNSVQKSGFAAVFFTGKIIND